MKVYHLSNPLFRDKIKEEGLTAQTGWSYRYNHGETVKPAIFFSLTWENRFDSTYDDDLYEVNIEGIEYEIDPKNHHHILTYQELISPDKIKLIHSGTGK